MVDATRLGAWLRSGEGIGWLTTGTTPNSLHYGVPFFYIFPACVFCYCCLLFVVFVLFRGVFVWSSADVPLIFFCPADHAPDWQRRSIFPFLEDDRVDPSMFNFALAYVLLLEALPTHQITSKRQNTSNHVKSNETSFSFFPQQRGMDDRYDFGRRGRMKGWLTGRNVVFSVFSSHSFWTSSSSDVPARVTQEEDHIHTYILIPPWEDQREWHRMTRMTRPDCAVMCNFINIHTYIHTYIHRRKITQDFSSTFFLRYVP